MPYRLLADPGKTIDYAGVSLTGRQREVNEDAWGVLESANLFVVADGCGGVSSGRVAADMAVTTFRQLSSLQTSYAGTLPSGMDPLAAAACEANAKIFRAATGTERGMGCAVAALRFDPPWVVTVAIGDCRIYRYRYTENHGQKLMRMTTEHELWTWMLKFGAPLDDVLRARTDHGNVIMRALGTCAEMDVEVEYSRHLAGDLYLLCTDGLTRQLPDQDICAMVSDEDCPLDLRCTHLAEAADARVGADNVTALLLRGPSI